MPVKLHEQLAADCYLLGTLSSSRLLLHKNALIPWFIVVPDTEQTELFKLPPEQQQLVQSEINAVAEFTQQHFNADKLNIATIGNIVTQLHVHVIGRKIGDFCWPSPVWGRPETAEYPAQQLAEIKLALLETQLLQAI